MISRINQNWVFGRRARLDFSTNPPTASAGTAIDTFEGCASISDAAGNLLLYTDGRRVWNGANAVVASGLDGHPSSTQSAIIVPDPANATRYYVFTADGATGGNRHFGGRRIDTATGTVEDISTLMTMPPTRGFSPTERVTAVQHTNCRDFWVLTVITRGEVAAPVGAGILRVFRVTPAGVQHVGDTSMVVDVHDIGYLKASGDGRRLALANYGLQQVLVFPFDPSTGTLDVANRVIIPVQGIPLEEHRRAPYGVEFSPSTRLLYYTVLGDHGGNLPTTEAFVFQHDLSAPGPSVLIGSHRNTDETRYALGAVQLGMDGRIYVAQDGDRALGVIADPDVPGPGCGLTFSALALPRESVCFMGLPNLIPNPCGCPPCDEGHCDHAVKDANKALSQRAAKKTFTIPPDPGVRLACVPAFEPRDLSPVFSLHWGDGSRDQFESHDTEILFIRARNPFNNLEFRGLKIFGIRVTPNQALPDGEPALQLVPGEIVCFDDVPPCGGVVRDFAFLIQNAVPQAYQITFEWCVDEIVLSTGGTGRAAFDIDVVAS